MTNAQRRFPTLTMASSIEEALTDAEIVLHLTEWSVFREIDPVQAKVLMKSARMIDGRNALDLIAWRQAGFEAKALGRP
jgi:UDPglucose 6-dehydrogenase